jgi:GT2 family glycosyltransferase
MLSSILIATTGGQRLPEVVRTYLRQPVAEIEIVVVVDNPALDGAGLLAEFRSDERLRLVFNDIVLRNDDDDLPNPDRVARTAAFFESNPGCDLVYGFARGVDGAGRRSWIIGGPASDAEIKARLRKRNFIVHSAIAFRSHRLKQIGGYDPTFRYAQDYDLYLRCIRAGFVFGCIPDILVEHAYHAESITVKRRRRQILCSFAARLIHDAEASADGEYWRTVLAYLKLLAIPNAARTLRRRVGLGR